MHRVSFLPLTAPLAPVDTNWMRKQNARLYVAKVAGVLSPGSYVPELERLFWSGGSVTVSGAQNTYSRNPVKSGLFSTVSSSRVPVTLHPNMTLRASKF